GQLRAVDRAHRSDRRRGIRRLLREQQPRHRDAAQQPDDAAHENQVDERKPLRFSSPHALRAPVHVHSRACAVLAGHRNPSHAKHLREPVALQTVTTTVRPPRYLTNVDTYVSVRDGTNYSEPARIRRSLRPSTRSRSVGGMSWKRQLIACTMTRHCATPVTMLIALSRALSSSGTRILS